MADDDVIAVGKPLPRIRSATPMEGRVVRIVWEGGSTQEVDLRPAFANHRAFVRLRKDGALFKTLSVAEMRNALEWADGSELSAVWIEELALGSLSNAEFREAMDRMKMSLDGMAGYLGIARRLVASYRKDKRIPRHIALATRYLLQVRDAG